MCGIQLVLRVCVCGIQLVLRVWCVCVAYSQCLGVVCVCGMHECVSE